MDSDAPKRLALAYARMMDDKAFDQLHEIMTEDCVMASPAFEARGIAAFREQLAILDDYSATMHLVGNQFGEWNGDQYQGETYCVATHIYEKDGVGRKWEVGIRYQDTITADAGDYRYTRRYLNVLWQADQPLNC